MQNKQEKKIIFRRMVRSYLSSVISISLVLFLVGAVSFFAANTSNVSNYFKENAIVSVILSPTATEKEGQELCKKLQEREDVKSAKYISKEDGEKEMEEMLGKDFLNVFEVNPIPISIDLNVKGEYFTEEGFDKLKREIGKLPSVREVTYQESLVEALNSNLEKIVLIILVIIAGLLAISFVLIGNTMRLSVYAKRFTIHTMRLVGAQRSFICKPFLRQAAIQGMISAAIADILLLLALKKMNSEFGNLFTIFDSNVVYAVLIGVFVTGIVICAGVSWVVVNKLAYISKDELYY
ncbi:MAG: cell division protein FtsX [Bacteroidales bacterium]|nr:cell division protein FtsX [Bacteroidales bacterium]